MSLHATGWARTVPLPPSQKLVLLALSFRVNPNDPAAVSWPSYPAIQDETGLGKNTVIRALEKLAKAGLIRMVSRDMVPGSIAKRIRGRPNIYVLNVPTTGTYQKPKTTHHGYIGPPESTHHGYPKVPTMGTEYTRESIRESENELKSAPPLGERRALIDQVEANPRVLESLGNLKKELAKCGT